MQYDEKTVKAALKLILDVVAEDKQEIKELTKEKSDLAKIAEKYIKKCDELAADNVRLLRGGNEPSL